APQAGRRRVPTRAIAQESVMSIPTDLDGFRVDIDPARERADIVLDRPPLNVIFMPQRDHLRAVFEALDRDPRVPAAVLRRAAAQRGAGIVVRSAGENFSSGGRMAGFMEASPEHVSMLADNVAAPERCRQPVIAAVRGYCFGVGFELTLACDFRIASETAEFG